DTPAFLVGEGAVARFIARRMISSVLILLVVSAVTFFLFFAVPGDPARLSCGKICPPSRLAEIHHNLGLDRPLVVQSGDHMHGIVARALFVDKLRWLPQPGYTPLTSDPAKWFSGLLLPWIVLAFVSAALYARLTRASMIEALQEDFVRTGRARGLARRSILFRH